MEAERPDRRNRIAVAAAVAAAALLLTFRLLIPPIVGLADNGDFERLMKPAGLAYATERPDERYFGWMQPRFPYTTPAADPSGYRSSESLVVAAAVWAAHLLSKTPFFDVRFLGALHALLLIVAIGTLVAACRDLAPPAQAAAALLLVFFFTDPGYTAPFNSLYSQTASFVFLLSTAAAAALAVRRGRLSGGLLVAYFLATALFVCGKPQEIVHAPLLALLGVRLAWPGARTSRRVLSLALAGVLCALAARYYVSAERSLGWITRYNIVFLVLLPSSPDPAADLIELGLDPSLARYSGMSAWVPESPASDPGFRSLLYDTSPRAFLLRHPERIRPVLGAALRASYVLRPPELGNFARESGRPAQTLADGPWSAARAVLGGAPWLAALFGGTLLAAALTYRRATPRGRLFRETLAVAVLMAVAAFAVAVAGDTHVELVRHLYTSEALCDLILIADVVWIVQALATRMRSRVRRESSTTGAASHGTLFQRLWSPVPVALGVAAVILAVQLLIPPIVGLANNGDFEKVMGYAGLSYGAESLEEKYFSWIVTKFVFVPPGWYRSGYLTSETFLASLARVLALPLARGGPFDIRVLGAIHVGLLLAGIGLLVAASRDLAPLSRWVVGALLVFFFTDVGYAAVLNSFYSQTASLIFLVVTLGAAALAIRRGRLDGAPLLLYFAGAFLFVGSKPQESVLGPILAVFAVGLSGPRPARWIRLPALWLALALCAFSVWYNLRTPVIFRQIALYDAVFFELLPHSPDPAGDLRELGLDAALLQYSGQSPYAFSSPVGDPGFQARFYAKLDYRVLLRFYLRHPGRLVSVVNRGTHQAFQLRSPALGNYEKALGLPPRARTGRFAVWSDMRLRLTPHAWLWLALLFGGNLFFALAGYRRADGRGRLVRKGVVLLVLLAGVEFLVCDLADSLNGADRHLFVFHALLDLLLIADAAWIAEALSRRRRPGLDLAAAPAT
ncbi:MAG: hypothetical protein WAU32_08685 [Thermoanaerobaculia bacterium]